MFQVSNQEKERVGFLQAFFLGSLTQQNQARFPLSTVKINFYLIFEFLTSQNLDINMRKKLKLPLHSGRAIFCPKMISVRNFIYIIAWQMNFFAA